MVWSNLHTHSEYSLLDGFGSPEAFAKRAADLGQPALALTDHGNLYGAARFAKACRKAGIKPILGCELYVADGPRTQPPGPGRANYFHLTALALNRQGWQNLMWLVADASTNGMYYKPRVDRQTLADHREGLIVLSGCLGGEVNQLLLAGEYDEAVSVAQWYREVFGLDNYAIELMHHGQDDDAVVVPHLKRLAEDRHLRLVATADCHYPAPDDAHAADVLHCIATGKRIDDARRFRLAPFGRYYLPSAAEMMGAVGSGIAVENAGRIADMVEPDVLGFGGHVAFPELPWIVRDGETPDQALERIAREGRARRPGLTDEADARLVYELGVIERMGFASYFLIVYDYVRWARERGIVCGPRGSAAGSLVLYLLGVSDIDPLRWGLPFERFLNPDRVTMPDVDMDFADHRRGEVLAYLIQRYGAEHVGAIIAISTLGARAAIRDVGRALGVDPNLVDRMTAGIPHAPAGNKEWAVTLEDALDAAPELRRLAEGNAAARETVDTALKLYGTVRHATTHAAGVVVSAEPLVSVVPTQRPTGGGGLPACQWDMHDVEDAGLIKFDFLGLANLTMIERCLSLIEARTGRRLDLLAIPQDDQKAWEMLRAGHTKTVFQLEGRGMTSWSVELEPSAVEHLAAMVSLYRPGPMAQLPSYIARRHGRESVTYPHPVLEAALASTYGIPVYQEQVMAISRAYAGYSGGEADTLRKVMGKKLSEVVAAEREKFLARSEEQGHPRAEAAAIWAYIEPFSGYGFNRSHAVAYALIAYQTAYLKANHPVEWMAAVLATVADKPDKLASALDEARRLALSILAPSVNVGGVDFEPEGDGIRYGLGAVKGVGEAAAVAIVSERSANGPYRSLADFCRRVELKVVNRRVIEALAKAGAFDAFMARPTLLAVLDAAMSLAKTGGEGEPELPIVVPVDRADTLAWEREALGVYVTDHPFRAFRRSIEAPGSIKLGDIEPSDEGNRVTVVGYVAAARKATTKSGDPMAFVTLDDLTGSIELVVFPRTYAASASVWREGNILRVDGRVDIREGALQIIADAGKRWEPEPAELVEAARPAAPSRARCRVTIPARDDDADALAIRRLAAMLRDAI